MCRSTETSGNYSPYAKDRDRDRLKIRTFHLRFFSISSSSIKLPATLTLVYLPRISGNPLEINGAKIRADLPSFVALHRSCSMEKTAGEEAVYASADRVRAGEAVRFEVYLGSQKAVKGVFRRSGGMWVVECKSEMDLGRVGILGAEVLVGGERGVVMRERVEVETERRRRSFCLKLEEIVEEVEREGYDCCYDDDEDGDGGEDGDSGSDEEREKWEMLGLNDDDDDNDDDDEMERLKWMEMGIWVVCVGVGYLGYKGLRRRRFI